MKDAFGVSKYWQDTDAKVLRALSKPKLILRKLKAVKR